MQLVMSPLFKLLRLILFASALLDRRRPPVDPYLTSDLRPLTSRCARSGGKSPP